MINTKILKNSQKQQRFSECPHPQLWLQWSHFCQQYQNGTCTTKQWPQKATIVQNLDNTFWSLYNRIYGSINSTFQQYQITQKKKNQFKTIITHFGVSTTTTVLVSVAFPNHIKECKKSVTTTVIQNTDNT